MGGTQSTRSISVENRSPVSIQLSEAAARRILQSEPISAPAPPPAAPQETAPPQYKPHYDRSAEEQYWTNRIESLQNSHRAIRNKMDEEYDKSVAETTQMFKRAQMTSTLGKLYPCQKENSALLKCINNNSAKPLLCADYVNTFENCVSAKRSETIASGA